MIRKVTDSPLGYTINEALEMAVAHNHIVCDMGCSVPLDVKYIMDGEEKKLVRYGSGFYLNCTCWKTE